MREIASAFCVGDVEEHVNKASCLDTGAVALWLETRGRAASSPEVHVALEEHLETCAECRALVIELARETGSLAAAASATRSGGRDAAVLSPPLEVGALVGRYRVKCWLGAGGMGVVYDAYDPELDRQVALKVLRPVAAPHVQGLLDEARAAARVAHPNVVTVYDAGTHDDGRVYLAMELVRGETLAAWAAKEARSPEAVVARFVQAARGLAAIHAAGLVHGDFKPQNVLLGGGDRVLLSDFGLARESAGEPDDGGSSVPVMGTPRYMAPEQLRGAPADPLADQYAFCVALHEALTGAAPLPGAPLRSTPRLPPAARRVLARGLALDRAARFASMNELLVKLTPRRRLVSLPAALAAAVVACACAFGLSLAYARRHASAPPDPCAGAPERLAGVWDETRRAAVAATFARSSAPYAADVGREVLARLDGYAQHWRAMSTESCMATRVRAAQSEELFDLRASCLDDRARTLGALGAELLDASRQEQQRAPSAAVALPPLEECADAATLRARVRPSSDPAARAEAERFAEALARGQALLLLGKYPEAKELAQSALSRASTSSDRTAEARLDLLLGNAEKSLGDDAGADAALYAAAQAAESASDEVTKAEAWIALTEILAAHESKFSDAGRAGKFASATLSRLPGEAELHAQLEDSLSTIESGQGHLQEALVRREQALAVRLAALDPDDLRVGASLIETGGSATAAGDGRAAVDYLQRGVAVLRKVLGSDHPRLATALYDLHAAQSVVGDLAAAEATMRESYAIWMASMGPDHPWTYFYESGWASALEEGGHAEEALAHARRAVELADRAGGKWSADVNARVELGSVYLTLRRYDEALATMREAVARLDAQAHPPDREGGATYEVIGRAYLESGRPRAAVTAFEQALARYRAGGLGEVVLAEMKVLLGRALRASGGDRTRAAALDQEGRAVFARHPEAARHLAEAEGAPPR
jgi:tetratricopeptide (TPR) repeat protein